MSASAGGIEQFLSQLGARIDPDDGLTRVLDYGDAEVEEKALRTGVAITWRSWRSGLRVSGPERAPFLHRLLSGGVTDLAAGSGGHSLLLDQRGKVVADLDLWIDQDEILLFGDRPATGMAIETLQRYILRSAVSIEAIEDSAVLALLGPGAADVLERAGVDWPPESGLVATQIGGMQVRLLHRSRQSGSLEILVRDADAEALWREITGGSDVVAAGWTASEVLRIENGLPAHGAELTGVELPQEVRLDDAIDFDKGCYLGQETVARIHYRGHVNRLLCGLRPDEPVAPGDGLICGDRPTGTVTSAAVSTLLGPVALAYVRTDDAEPGTVIQTESGIEACIAVLPMRDGG